jgi:hypothetical protein
MHPSAALLRADIFANLTNGKVAHRGNRTFQILLMPRSRKSQGIVKAEARPPA